MPANYVIPYGENDVRLVLAGRAGNAVSAVPMSRAGFSVPGFKPMRSGEPSYNPPAASWSALTKPMQSPESEPYEQQQRREKYRRAA